MADHETVSEESPVNEEPRRPSLNYFAWLGPVVTFVAAVSYFLYFVRFPDLRDFPWVNLPLVGIGVLLSIVGLKRAFGVPGYGLRSKIFASIAGLASTGLAALFTFYIFSLSYQMPGADQVVDVSQPAPEFSLQDQNQQIVKLADYRGKKLVIAFYRGHW